MAANDVKDDIKELQCLLDLAQRPKIKDVLTVQIRKWQSDLIRVQEEQQKKTSTADGRKTEETTESKPTPVKPAAEKTTVKEIRQYAWDQSDKFMKLYVDVPGAHTVPEANLTSHFQTRYVKVSVTVGKIVYNVAVGPFHSDIITAESKCKVKADKLLIMLKKEKEKETWPYLVAKQTKKTKGPPPVDDTKDPNENLMTMLKQMYDDGDDEMKRTIAKSFYQSQQGKKDTPMDM